MTIFTKNKYKIISLYNGLTAKQIEKKVKVLKLLAKIDNYLELISGLQVQENNRIYVFEEENRIYTWISALSLEIYKLKKLLQDNQF